MNVEESGAAAPAPESSAPSETWDWERLYAELAPRLLSLGARRYRLSPEDCEDALQRAVLAIAASAPTVRSREAYLTTCFTRECLRIARGRADRKEVELDEAHHPPNDPSARLQASCLFNRGLHLIPPPCRGLISAWAVQGYSVRDAASRSSLSTATAYKRLARCLKKLTDAIA